MKNTDFGKIFAGIVNNPSEPALFLFGFFCCHFISQKKFYDYRKGWDTGINNTLFIPIISIIGHYGIVRQFFNNYFMDTTLLLKGVAVVGFFKD
ncbi:MAG: hypothetical protein ACLQF0_08710 [Dissulfurispiraceae bacterium]